VASQSEITWRLDKSSSCDKDESKSESKGLLSRSEITHGEHPLSLGKTSIWNQFFQVSYQVNSWNMGRKSHFWNLRIFYTIHTILVTICKKNFIVPYLRKLTILVPFGSLSLSVCMCVCPHTIFALSMKISNVCIRFFDKCVHTLLWCSIFLVRSNAPPFLEGSWHSNSYIHQTSHLMNFENG